MFRAITASFALVAAGCLLLSMWVGFRSLILREVPIGQPAALFAVAVVLLAATRAMWDYARWARNVATAVAVCLLWVIGDAMSRRVGVGQMAFKFPCLLLAAMCMAYFTGPTGRALFRKDDAPATEGEHV